MAEKQRSPRNKTLFVSEKETKELSKKSFVGTPNGDHFGITLDENSMNKSMAKSKPTNYEQI